MLFRSPKQRQNGNGDVIGFRNISGVSGTSTIEAPLESESERKKPRPDYALAALSSETNSPHQAFEKTQLHRHPDMKKDTFPNAGFRFQEGAFGTPAPLPTVSEPS